MDIVNEIKSPLLKQIFLQYCFKTILHVVATSTDLIHALWYSTSYSTSTLAILLYALIIFFASSVFKQADCSYKSLNSILNIYSSQKIILQTFFLRFWFLYYKRWWIMIGNFANCKLSIFYTVRSTKLDIPVM